MSQQAIVLVAALPPPHGGVATWTRKIIDKGLPNGKRIVLVNASVRENRQLAGSVYLSWKEVYRTLNIVISCTYQLIRYRPQVLHISCSCSPVGVFRDLICALIAKTLRIPVISHYRGNVPDFPMTRMKGLSGWALKKLARCAQVNLVENIFSLQAMKPYLKQTASLYLLPNFVDDSIFDNMVADSKILNKRPRALFVGWIIKTKGCREILESAAQLPQVDFYFIGKIYADMAPLCQSVPNNVHFLGVMNHDQVLKEMCQSDFLLFPTYTEGFPLSVVEAMSVGLPVIATKVGAIPEMISDKEGGFLVNAKDVSGLIEAIQLFLADPTLKEKMGMFNRQKAFAEYRYTIVANQLQLIYAKFDKDYKS